MLLWSEHETRERPTVLALGVKREGRAFVCEVVYVADDVSKGPLRAHYLGRADGVPEGVTIAWPGLPTARAGALHPDPVSEERKPVILKWLKEEPSA